MANQYSIKPVIEHARVYYSILGYIAYIKANPRIWVAGSTPNIAIKKLYRIMMLLDGWGDIFNAENKKRSYKFDYKVLPNIKYGGGLM